MSEPIKKAEYSGKLAIGDMEFPCSVLSDGERILTQSDFMEGMGMYYSGWIAGKRKKKDEPAGLPHFLAFKSLQPFVEKHLGDLQSITVKFKTARGSTAHGIRAEIIPKICEVWLDAEENSKLGIRQVKIAHKAKILVRALAHVGIVALVDEATGYQAARARDALERILEEFIAKELGKWAKRFPDEFYKELFRLRGWQYQPFSVKRPSLVGRLTNNMVYERLAPGVLDELKQQTPRNKRGQHVQHLHRRLTEDVGHPRLQEHLSAVIALMKISKNWDDFKRHLERALPKWPKVGETYQLPLSV